MVIGNGLLGKALVSIDSIDYVFFASGVSDSKTNDISQFEREFDLLKSMINKDKCLVYFSTSSIDNPEMKDSLYVRYKLEFERFIKNNFVKYVIVRTSNIVGFGGNSKTVVNFFYNAIRNNTKFEVWENSYRNILDVEVLIKMLNYYLSHFSLNETIYLCNPIDVKVIEIIDSLEKAMNKKAINTKINKGSNFEIDKKLSINIINDLELANDIKLDNCISKYYLNNPL